MSAKKAYQFDEAGLLAGVTEADESPLEPGVFLLPARCTLTPPPEGVPADKWPRWNGVSWNLVNRSVSGADEPSPVEKLRAFLSSNPDVAQLLESGAP